MIVHVRPYKSKLMGIFITLVFSGPGMMFYVDLTRGLFVSILEIVLIILFKSIILGIAIGTIIAVFWSSKLLEEYIEIYRRQKAMEEVFPFIPEEFIDGIYPYYLKSA